MRWHERAFAELTPHELYAITSLRERVFVVEQRCAYLDADGADLRSRHVWATGDDDGDGDGGALLAYLRIVPAGVKFPEISIGRVITAPEARGTGLGRLLMERGIALVGAHPIRIGAQAHLERFYASLGFDRVSGVYDEDGIPHVEMLRTVT